MLPLQGMGVQALVGDLRSHMPCSMAKKKKDCFNSFSLQFCGIKYIHVVVQSLPPSTSRTFLSSHTEPLYPVTGNSPFLPPLSHWRPSLYQQNDVSTSLTILGTSGKWNITIFVLISLSSVLKLHSCCSMCEDFFLS